ncbi:MAG: AsmA family protein [Methylophagaceae bacterium]
MGKIIKISAGLFIIAIIGVIIVISNLDINQYKGEIVNVVEEATARKLQIGGDLQFGLSLIPTVIVEDVKFSNAKWGSKPEMLSLDKLEIKVSILPLLRGNIQVNKVVLLAPKVLLETNKSGLGNWVFASKSSEEKKSASESSSPAIIVNEVHIKQATITYKDGVTGQETNIVIDKIISEAKGANDPLSVIVKAAYNEIPIEVKGSLGSLTQLSSNDNYPIDLTVNVSDASINLEGQVAKPLDGKGLDVNVKFNIDSLSTLSALAASELPNIGPINFSGKVTDSKNGYSIKSMNLLLGATDLSGDLAVNVSGTRPSITAKLSSKIINLIELAGNEPPEEKQPAERIFSPDPLPLEGLKAINANLTINAQQIISSSLVLDNTKVVISLKDGNLAIKPLTTLIAGGSLSGDIRLNTSGGSAALMTDISIKGLEPSQFGDLQDTISGVKTDVNINVKGSGNSISQIMAGLNGKLLLKSDKGVIKGSNADMIGADILSMLNPTTKNSDDTQLECAVINFNIKEGIATADKGIAFSTQKMNVIGSGSIDLKTEKLDIGINPQAREGVGLSVGKLASLVRLGGTLAAPSAVIDAKGALTTGLSAGTAVATGGLSLLVEGLLESSTADDSPCQTALGIKSTTVTPKQAEPSATENAVETAKDLGNSVTDKLKSLF